MNTNFFYSQEGFSQAIFQTWLNIQQIATLISPMWHRHIYENNNYQNETMITMKKCQATATHLQIG